MKLPHERMRGNPHLSSMEKESQKVSLLLILPVQRHTRQERQGHRKLPYQHASSCKKIGGVERQQEDTDNLLDEKDENSMPFPFPFV